MKGLFIALSLLTSGIAATFGGVQDKVVDYYHMATNRFGIGTEVNSGYDMYNYMHGSNYGYGHMYGYTEEMQAFMEFQIELVSQYDFSQMSEEEITATQQEINDLLNQKAQELGLDLPDFSSGFGPGMMYGYASVEQTELMYYMHELMFSYDWSNMNEDEILKAKEDIDLLIQEKADELGLEAYGFGHMGGFGYNGSFGGCHGGSRFGSRFGGNRYYRGM